MHAFHVPLWVYCLLALSLLSALLSVVVLVLNARRSGRIRLTTLGRVAWAALLVVAALCSVFFGLIAWVFGGLR